MPAQGPVAEVSQALGELVGDFKLHLPVQEEGTGGFKSRSIVRLVDILSLCDLHNKVCR